MFAWGARKPQMLARRCEWRRKKKRMVDGCKNRNRLSPQIAVVVRSSWPCHRFAVYIGAEMLHEEGPTFCQRRWHRRETVHELHCLLNDALAR